MNIQELQESPLGRAHRRLHNVWLHDVADRMRQRRQVIAQSEGLDPNDVEHYPVSGDVTIVNGATNTGRTAMLGAALLLLGGVASLIGAKLYDKSGTPSSPNMPPATPVVAPNQPAPSPATPTPAPPPQQFRIRFWAEDGTEIPVQNASEQEGK